VAGWGGMYGFAGKRLPQDRLRNPSAGLLPVVALPWAVLVAALGSRMAATSFKHGRGRSRRWPLLVVAKLEAGVSVLLALWLHLAAVANALERCQHLGRCFDLLRAMACCSWPSS